MHVFIDTNILLTFFHFTDEELDSLQNVFASHKHGAATVHLTGQIRDEFRRNRETRIKDALKRFTQNNYTVQLPSFMKAYDEYVDIRKLASELREKSEIILARAREDVATHKLVADKLIEELFDKSELIGTSDEIYATARRRMFIGNPPGKNQSIGDAINWLILLRNVPNGEDIHIISADGDFYSTLDDNRVHPFLEEEWREIKGSRVYVYRKLAMFMKKHFDGIAFSYDKEKDELIDDLAGAGSFAGTHTVISKLETHGYYSLVEVQRILEGVLANNQVRLIVTDHDVSDFLYRVAVPRRHELTNPAPSRHSGQDRSRTGRTNLRRDSYAQTTITSILYPVSRRLLRPVLQIASCSRLKPRDQARMSRT